jgi:predicted amidohydrolase
MDVKFGDREGNTACLIDNIHSLSNQDVDIVVFPECAIGGYCIDAADQAFEIAISRTAPYLHQIQAAVDETGVHAIFGFAEATPGGYFNTAALLTPHEESRFYRKTHLPELGYDRFVGGGDELPIFETKFGKIGILICFDIRFPEASRILALKGADAIILPTNWPKGADVSADVLAVARAVENKVYMVTCNRVGTENGFSFIGKSKIISPMGAILAEAQGDAAILIADADFEASRNKRNITIPGKHETTVFESRRPELYESILRHTEQIASNSQ